VRAARLGVGGAGLVVAAYGAWLVLGLPTQWWPGLLVWLVAGVVLHDAVLAPVVVLVGLGLRRVVPEPARGPVVVGAVVLGSVTLVAVPALGRFGARPDNPTLLDRPYLAGWLVLAALVALGVAVATLVRSRRGAGRDRV
jgi:hypothetical protein